MASRIRTTTKALQQQIADHETTILFLREQLSKAKSTPCRIRLPTTRSSITHKFTIGEHDCYVTVGLFDDNRPGEVFLRMSKEGSTLRGLMDTIGILTSLALQYGVPVKTLAHKFEHVSFEPSGWTENPSIRHASSIIDYIFRWLGLQFSDAYKQEKLAADNSLSEVSEQQSLAVQAGQADG
jgi:ribonucleoside-diphosphate reductase alpha chain